MKHATLVALLAAAWLAATTEEARAQNLSPGDVVHGRLASQSSSDVYRLALTVGDKVVVRVRGMQKGLNAPDFTVVGPDSVQIASASGRRVNRTIAIAQVTGAQQITVSGAAGASLGYVLRIKGKRVAPYQPPPGGDPAPLPEPPAGMAERSHFYLPAAMLGGERGEDLLAAEGKIEALADEPAGLALDELQRGLAEPIIGRIFEALALAGRDTDPLGRAGLERVLDVVDANRRAEAAEIRLAKLGEAVAGTRLDGDGPLAAGMSMAAGAIADTRAAIDDEIAAGIPGGGQEPPAAGLAVPDLPTDRGNLVGRATLERIVMGTMMDRARSGDRGSADSALGLYEAYAVLLAESAPFAARRRADVDAAIDELRAILAASPPSLGLEAAEHPAPGIGEPFDLLVRVSGVEDQSAVAWDVPQPDGLDLEAGFDGLRIRSAGEAGPRTIAVRAAHDGLEGEIEVYVEPQHEPRPLFEVAGELQSPQGSLAGAVVELRSGHPEGGVASTPGGRPLSTQADEHGRFSLPYAEAAEYWLAVLVDGELAEVRQVPAGDPVEVERLNRIDLGEIRIDR